MFKNSWPNIRAALIALHLIAITLKAIPSPEGGMNRKDWKNPTVQAEFKAYSAQLNQLGIPINAHDLEESLWRLSKEYMQLRRAALKPFRFYYRHVGADQNWHLFIAPHMFPSRLILEIRNNKEEEWHRIYEPFNADARWYAHLIEEARFRPSIFRYSWGRYKYHYKIFSRYLAVKAAEDFPMATDFRTRWLFLPSPSPEDILNSSQLEGTFKNSLLHDLSALRKGQEE